jgi:hypothetical protein
VQLIEPFPHKSHRELRSEARGKLELREEVLRRPDVIEVTVREEDAFDKFFLSLEEGDIGNEIINPEHILFRELETEIDNE